MTTGPRSQCDTCARLRSPWEKTGDQFGEGGPFCAAFPAQEGGIPDVVYNNGADHRQPVDGDHGIRWLAKAGETFPECAFKQPA